MILVLMIFAIFLFILGIEFAAAKLNWHWKYLPLNIFPLLRSVAQNYLLTQLYGWLGDVVMFATLQYRTLQFKSKSEWIDFFVSILFLLVVFSIPVWNFLFILKYRKVKKLSENKNDKEILMQFRESNQGVKLFFDDFSDKFRAQQFFLIFLIARDLIFNLLLTTLFDHPLAQMIILLVLNIAMIIYLLWKSPFDNFFNFLQQIFYEALFFLALITLLALIGIDMQNSPNSSARDVLGKILIVESLLYTYGTIFITCLKVLMIALEFLKKYRQQRAQRLQTDENIIPTQETPRHLFSLQTNPSLQKKPSVLSLESQPDDKKDLDEEVNPVSLPTSENCSPRGKLISLPTETEFLSDNLEAKKIIKLRKSKTPHPNSLQEKSNCGNDDLQIAGFEGKTIKLRASKTPHPSSPIKNSNDDEKDSPIDAYDAEKAIKFVKSKTPHPGSLNQTSENKNENSLVIDHFMELAFDMNPSSPSNLIPESPRKNFKFIKDFKDEENL